MTPEELEEVLEALRSARAELEGLEADQEFYVPTGPLMDRIDRAEQILEQFKDAE